MSSSLSLGRRLALGTTVSVLSLLLFVGGLEGVLRLVGFGHPVGFAREETDAKGLRWWRENRWATTAFFPPELIRVPQPFRIAVEKSANTYRVFVLGSSAAMGDPEPSFSLSRMLELMLRASYPQLKFEIVNAGITAVNSNVVRGVAEDCAKLQPDLFIVYEGNNEVIGPYGPGTVFSGFLRSPRAIALSSAIRGTRTGQLLSRLARRLGGQRASLEQWGGMEMFLQQKIAADDPRLVQTRETFRQNLQSIGESAKSAGARCLLCTVLTNQKDFAPFWSEHRPGLSAAQLSAWQRAFDDGKAAYQRGDLAAAEANWRTAAEVDAHYAELAFQIGRLKLQQQQQSEAQKQFQRAVDLDTLRFRTDSALNATIAQAAAGGAGETVDLVRAIEGESPTGILGDEELYEHVHLNFQGTYLAARELFRAVSEDLLRRKRITAEAKKIVPALSLADARHQLGYTTYEQAMIIHELVGRFSRPPFTQQSDQAARLAIYRQREEVARHILEKPESAVALDQLYQGAIAANPGDWILERNYGMALLAMRRPAEAKPHLEHAERIIPDDPDTLFAHYQAAMASGAKAEAGEPLKRLAEVEPNFPGLKAAQHP